MESRLWRRRIRTSASKSGLLCLSGEAESFPRVFLSGSHCPLFCLFAEVRCTWESTYEKRGFQKAVCNGQQPPRGVGCSGQGGAAHLLQEPGYLPLCCHGKQWPSQCSAFRADSLVNYHLIFFQGESPSYWFNLGCLPKGILKMTLQ